MANDGILPPLRDDLKLIPSIQNSGAHAFETLYDPVRNRFFRLGPLEFELIKHWPQGNPEAVIAGVNATTPYQVTPATVQKLLHFLMENCLLAPTNPEIRRRLQFLCRRKQSIGSWLLHHYLYFRIPLIHPDRFLTRTLPLARLLATRTALYFFGVLSIIGVFLIARQWEAFKNTFLYFFTVKGMVLYALAIFSAKVLHELGHAYTAKHYGLKVPSMGLAFMVLWPMFFTENSEGWKLAARGPRLRIVSAGVLTELVLAGLAALLWSFLADGPLKSACFITATATWVSSVFINLSPFMRFDGYYLLADYLDFPNLQTRAFALAKWHLRRLLWGSEELCPEGLSEKRRRFVIVYAYATWLYRLVLFTGIALMVYHLFFKALGLLLFVVEMIWFIVGPIWRELKTWRRNLSPGALNLRSVITLLTLSTLLLFLALPIHSRIEAPALLKAAAMTRVYPPFAARISNVMVQEGDVVRQNDLLFLLDDPELKWQETKVRSQISLLQIQLERGVGGGTLLERNSVLRQRLIEVQTVFQGLKERRLKLRIRAPIDGVVLDMVSGLKTGVWIPERKLLALVADRSSLIIEGYLQEEHLAYVHPQDTALFFMENSGEAPIKCTVSAIDITGARSLEEPYLASLYGGAIAVRTPAANEMIIEQSLYRIILATEDDVKRSAQVMRGSVVINGRSQSLLKRAWMQIVTVLIRESGF